LIKEIEKCFSTIIATDRQSKEANRPTVGSNYWLEATCKKISVGKSARFCFIYEKVVPYWPLFSCH
jgi:hypothetical protein